LPVSALFLLYFTAGLLTLWAAARQAGQSPEFSRLIRFGRPGFEFLSASTKLASNQ
jgi:hypothetical protein